MAMTSRFISGAMPYNEPDFSFSSLWTGNGLFSPCVSFSSRFSVGDGGGFVMQSHAREWENAPQAWHTPPVGEPSLALLCAA